MKPPPQPLPVRNSLLNVSQFRHFPRWAGLIVAFVGGLAVISWHAHWQKILQLIPGTAPMKYNSALCFILLGAGLFLLTVRRETLAAWLGGAVGLVAGLTLVEYLTGWNLGLDLIFSKPFFLEPATEFPGRMSPLAAFCFFCLAAGLILAGKKSWTLGLPLAAALACVVGIISWVALCGYLFGIETAHDWGAFSSLAVNSAGTLLLFSTGLLVWVWLATGNDNHRYLRWLPAVASTTLLVMVAIVVTVNERELKQAVFWRQHTVQVILAGQSFLDNVLDLRRDLRGYVTLGDPKALADYHASVDLELKQWTELAWLTRDNPSQQERLQQLTSALKDLLLFDQRVISAYKTSGFSGVSRLDATGEGSLRLGRVRGVLAAFSQAERQLLVIRSATEAADSNKSTRLLVLGCGMASVFLLLGTVMASREVRLRQKVETKLTTALTLQNAILVSANYAIVAMDQHGVVKTFNSAAEKMLGYPAEEVIGQATPRLWSEVAPAGTLPATMGMENWLARAGLPGLGEHETTFIRQGGQRFPVLVSITALLDARGGLTGFLAVIGDISERKLRDNEREKLIAELQTALAEVKTLTGLIPICSWCKHIRSDKGFWLTVEQYVHRHTDASFSHGICPECAAKLAVGKPPTPASAPAIRN